MIEIGTFLLRTESELVLKSRRVVPGRLLEDGFAFEFPTWPPSTCAGAGVLAADRTPAAVGLVVTAIGPGVAMLFLAVLDPVLGALFLLI